MDELSINLQWQWYIRHCAQHAKQGIVAELDCGVAVYWTQSNLSFTNGIFLSTAVVDELDLCRRFGEIKAYVRKVQPTFPWQLYIEPEWLPPGVRERVQEICLMAEFAHASDFLCMQTTRLLPPVRSLPTAEIKFMTSPADVHDAVLLNVQAYNMDEAIAENAMEHRAYLADFDKQVCCVVSVKGEPIATATTQLLDECLYVALVATSAQHRKVCFILNLCVLYIC
jgi:hypothetical protein